MAQPFHSSLDDEVTIREWQTADTGGLAELMAEHLTNDNGWPPQGVRGGDLESWFAKVCNAGRFVAVRGTQVVGHAGLFTVDPTTHLDAAMWHKALGEREDPLVEVVRGVVRPSERRRATAAMVTGHAMRIAVLCGTIPVATAFTDREAALAMMQRYGWEVVGSRPSTLEPSREILALIPPHNIVAEARAVREKGCVADERNHRPLSG